MTIQSINPATGEPIESYEEMSAETVAGIVDRVHQAHLAWKETGFERRSKLMHDAGQALRDQREKYAERMVAEMGKPIRGARSEVDKCAWVCDYYADNAESFLAPQEIASDAGKSRVVYRPLGVVLAVMPWNFPFWQVLRFAAPTMMAGNGAVLKHASNVPGCALDIEGVFRDAGFPQDLFRTLMIGSSAVEAVIEHPRVRAVTLTGSGPAGRAVAAAAGKNLKKTVLELGGSDPYVILEDADLEQAVQACVDSRLINSGQSCIAAKRFIVPRAILGEFERKVVIAMRAKTMGDPTAEATDVGPQARRDLRDELHQQVARSVEAGARCLLGGEVPDGPGAFYPPTVLTGVAAGMAAYDEELFGPVAAILPAEDEEDALRIANDSPYGLGAAVFTANVSRGEEIAATRLEAGCCFVNDFVRSDPRLPFGGIKESGYGRELSEQGIREFINVKTVWVR
jgi:succinate-semialdehyde dehydrogenase/glutarate-semialdehyde dehydrogenase